MDTVDNPPAFPVPPCEGVHSGAIGMTLRDYFAAKAMQSLLIVGAERITNRTRKDGSSYDSPGEPYYFGWWEPNDADSCEGVAALAMDAYLVADSMLAERARRMKESK